MTRALLYLEARSTVGAMRAALTRLKRPRYFVTTLGGLVYVWFCLSRPVPSVVSEVFEAAARPGITVLLAATFCLTWLLGSRGTLHFTPAEIDFLFPAPVSRRELLRYRLLKFQKGLLALSGVFSVFAAAWGAAGRSLAIFAASVVTLNVLMLHGVAVNFVFSRARGAVALLCRLAPLVLVVVGLGLTYRRLSPPAPDDLTRWLNDLVTLGPAGIVLAPADALAKLFFSYDLAAFGAHLLPALLLAGLLYLVVERVDFPFEEFEIEGAELRTTQLEALRRGRIPSLTGRIANKAKPTRWPLAPTGPPWRAIAWKNLVGASRRVPPVILWVMLAGLLLSNAVALVGSEIPAKEFASAYLAGLALLLSFAPLIWHGDLRNDLKLLDVLKSVPLSGRDLLRGEALGPSLVVGGAQVMLLLAAFLLHLAAARSPAGLSAPVVAASISIVALPALTIATFTVVNGLVLLFPAWTRFEFLTTAGASVGVENLGRMMVMLLGVNVALGVLLVPPSVVGALIGLLGYFVIGVAAVPVAAVVAAAVLLGENELLLSWLGGRLEKLDPSDESLLS